MPFVPAAGIQAPIVVPFTVSAPADVPDPNESQYIFTGPENSIRLDNPAYRLWQWDFSVRFPKALIPGCAFEALIITSINIYGTLEDQRVGLNPPPMIGHIGWDRRPSGWTAPNPFRVLHTVLPPYTFYTSPDPLDPEIDFDLAESGLPAEMDQGSSYNNTLYSLRDFDSGDTPFPFTPAPSVDWRFNGVLKNFELDTVTSTPFISGPSFTGVSASGWPVAIGDDGHASWYGRDPFGWPDYVQFRVALNQQTISDYTPSGPYQQLTWEFIDWHVRDARLMVIPRCSLAPNLLPGEINALAGPQGIRRRGRLAGSAGPARLT